MPERPRDTSSLGEADGVLGIFAPSLYADRVKVYPRSVRGSFRTVKWVVLTLCLGVYYVLPWLRWDRGPGAPDQALLLDMSGPRGYFFWIEIWPQEVYYITGLLVLGALALFLATALFGDEVVHHGQKAGREEKAHRVMTVPPLGQRILDPGEQRVTLGREQRYRYRQIVDDVQHRHGDDEGEIEPVCHVDVRLFAFDQRTGVGDQIDDPDQRQPEIDIPFRLGILFALRDAEHITKCREHDEELVTEEQKPADCLAAEQPRAAGTLHDIEGRAEQRIASEGEDGRRGVHRPQPAERRPFQPKVQRREGKLERDIHTGGEGGDAPEGCGDHEGADYVLDIGLAEFRSELQASGHGGHEATSE